MLTLKTLTPEQIDAMPAGREMDSLVAEQVMGWKYNLLGDAWENTGHGWVGYEKFMPSADIAAAWAVADMLHFSIISQHPIGWLVDTRSNTRLPFVEVYANTAPLAICRAALKVVTR